MRTPTTRTRSELATLYRSWTPYQRKLFKEGQEDSRVAGYLGKLQAENWAADAVEAIAAHGITEQQHVTLREPGEIPSLPGSGAASGEVVASAADRAAELIGRFLR